LRIIRAIALEQPLALYDAYHEKASACDVRIEAVLKESPKDFWNEFFPSPGLQTLAIRQDPRSDNLDGHCQVTVEPSVRIVPGVFISINDHFVISRRPVIGATNAMELLQSKSFGASTILE
jgi:hypothetical protein